MKIAFYSLTSCEGCVTTLITTLGPHLATIANLFDIEYFKMAREPVGGRKFPKVDIAFVEGAVVTDHDLAVAEEIRANSSTVVALGTCASCGNIAYTASREVDLSRSPLREVKIYEAEPISSVIHVDFELSGCPVNSEEFAEALMRLVNRIEPVQPDFNVCYECKMKGNECLLEGKTICLGPLAMGGCGSACPSVGTPCYSCRGPALEADLKAFLKTLERKGMSSKETHVILKTFTGKKAKEL